MKTRELEQKCNDLERRLSKVESYVNAQDKKFTAIHEALVKARLQTDRRANYESVERLKVCHRLLEERRLKDRNMNPTADAIPIMYDHIESLPKASDARYPITSPAIRLKAIFLRSLATSSIVRKIIKARIMCQSIRTRTSAALVSHGFAVV